MAAASREKTFSGTFLVPGVSLNKRLYTKAMIGKAVARMKARIADPDGLPIVMRTHHEADDDSRLIVARVVGVEQRPDGAAAYDARWYDTVPAHDIAALVQPEDGGPPGLRSVSIHGYFLGETRKVEVDGEEVVTSDDLEVDAIDFTATPGVVKALIDTPTVAGRRSETAPAALGRVPVFETWEVPVGENADALPVTEIATTDPDELAYEAYTAQQKRDALKAGQAMRNAKGQPSYTIKTKADLRRAIRAVGRGGADHDAVRRHVIKRAAALGLSSMIPGNWNADGSLKEAAIRFGEIRECYDSGTDGRAGFAIDAYNGPISLTLRAPSIDPSGLRAIASAAMDAAMDALGALDPDFDADIDVPGAPDADADGDMGAGEGAAHTPPDPNDIAPDDLDDETPEPGDACPCGCGCAVPEDLSAGPGCPCACGCETCGAATPERAAAAPGAPPAVEGAPVPPSRPTAETGSAAASPQSPVPDAAPVSARSIKESAVSETETPAVEAATPSPAPQVPAAAPLITLTQEQFAQLLGAARPQVAEAAPTVPQQPVAPAPVEPAPTQSAPAAPSAPAQETAPQTDLAETVATAVRAALAQAIPALRDSIVSQYGLPPRTGFRTTEADQNSAEMTAEQMWDNRADLLLGGLGKVG